MQRAFPALPEMPIGSYDACSMASRCIEDLITRLEQRGMSQRQAYRVPVVRATPLQHAPRCR